MSEPPSCGEIGLAMIWLSLISWGESAYWANLKISLVFKLAVDLHICYSIYLHIPSRSIFGLTATVKLATCVNRTKTAFHISPIKDPAKHHENEVNAQIRPNSMAQTPTKKSFVDGHSDQRPQTYSAADAADISKHGACMTAHPSHGHGQSPQGLQNSSKMLQSGYRDSKMYTAGEAACFSSMGASICAWPADEDWNAPRLESPNQWGQASAANIVVWIIRYLFRTWPVITDYQ